MRRYDVQKVIMSTGLTVGHFLLLPPEMEDVLRSFTPDAYDSDMILDGLSGVYFYLDPQGKRCTIPPDDVRSQLMLSMNLPGHGPIFGDA